MVRSHAKRRFPKGKRCARVNLMEKDRGNILHLNALLSAGVFGACINAGKGRMSMVRSHSEELMAKKDVIFGRKFKMV